MSGSSQLGRIRRIASGVFVAAAVAVAGLAAELSGHSSGSGHAATTRSTAAGVSKSAAVAVRPAGYRGASLRESGGWRPTAPLRHTHSAPHAHTAGT